MPGRFPPPPTWEAVVLQEEGRWVFSPVWLRWFGDLTKNTGSDGLPAGAPVEGVLVNTVFSPRLGTTEALDTITADEQVILEGRAFRATPPSLEALVMNDQSILSNQIFGA